MASRSNSKSAFSKRRVPERELGPDAEGTQRVGPLVELPELVRELGARPAGVLASVGISEKSLENVENRIPSPAVEPLLNECASKTGCAHFGLLLGLRTRLSHLGLLGQIVRKSPTLGVAIKNVAAYQHLNSPSVATFLSERNGMATAGVVVYEKGAKNPTQMCDLGLASMYAAFREACGNRLRIGRVLLSHSKPADARPYIEAFQAPCRFDADRTALIFSRRELDRRLADADSEKLQALEQQARLGAGPSLILSVRRNLRTLLLGRAVSLTQVARLLHMHSRTLNRRLKAEGTTFQKLLDEVRFDAACQLLDTARIPIAEIAVSLGYSDPAAFSRAFRRWSGVTPLQRRARQKTQTFPADDT
jgi:AraC-like DNA-binding protein